MGQAQWTWLVSAALSVSRGLTHSRVQWCLINSTETHAGDLSMCPELLTVVTIGL